MKPCPSPPRCHPDSEGHGRKGYLEKHTSPEDGRITYLTATEKGKQLSQRYNAEYFSRMLSYMEEIPEEDAACMIRTIQTLYRIMSERRHILDNE